MTQRSLASKEDQLRKELSVFYRALFCREPKEETMQYYLAAEAMRTLSATETRIMETIIDNNLDVEAVECASRKYKTPLTKKMHVALYLAEISPENFGSFYCEQSSRVKGYLLLGSYTLRSIYKLLKGKYLIWRYQLV